MAKKIFVVLGPKDSEMDAIEKVLKNLDVKFGYACDEYGKRCHPGNAYNTEHLMVVNSINPGLGMSLEGWEVWFVECNIAYQDHTLVIDHHFKGNPGYGMPAKQAVAASSLGQICNHLGFEMTQEMCVIAAADHNLRAAYEGRVPGVAPEEVLVLRGNELAARYSTDIEGFATGVRATANLLKCAPKVYIGGVEVADLRKCGVQNFMIDASLLSGIPAIGRTDARQPEKVFLSAPGEVVSEARQIEGPKWALVDPSREFATGTEEEKVTLKFDDVKIVDGRDNFPQSHEVGCVVVVVNNPVDDRKVECTITYTNFRPTDQEIFIFWTMMGQKLSTDANYCIQRMIKWPEGWSPASRTQ